MGFASLNPSYGFCCAMNSGKRPSLIALDKEIMPPPRALRMSDLERS
jgi:hypothetical protein